jgi:hypothetical protein
MLFFSVYRFKGLKVYAEDIPSGIVQASFKTPGI